jgi:glycosyltransferase involved in cell wall biosynthesis
MVKVSVIIPTYYGINHIRKTIQSIKNQNYSNYEILVVDNSCNNYIKRIVEEEKNNPGNEEHLLYIKEPEIGLHNARHRGAKEARGEILLYIDDDVIADRNLISEIVKFYKDKKVGCVGGKVVPKWEIDPPEWVTQFPKWYLSILDDEDGPKEVKWIYGCNFSIRKDLLFELGGFNPDAFADKNMWWMRGDGEIGLLRKVHHAGKKVIYNPNAIVWHFIPKKRMTVEYFKERAFKSGIEASFSRWRYSGDNFNPIKLFLRACKFGMCCILHNISAHILNKSGIRHKVTASYFKARCLYELRLITDKNLQRFLKQEKWLEV